MREESRGIESFHEIRRSPQRATKPLYRWAALLVSLAVWSAQLGCQIEVEHGPLPPPPSEEVRSQFGKMAVTSRPLDHSPQFQRPPAGTWSGIGRGAVAGMGIDAIVSLVLAAPFLATIVAPPTWPLVVVGLGILGVGIVLLPVAALAGAIYGGFAALPAKDVEDAIGVLQQAITDFELPMRIAKEIVEYSRVASDASLVVAAGPISFPAFDTVLSIEPPKLYLLGSVTFNPPLRMTASVPIQVIRVSDGALLHHFTLQYASPLRAEFLEWAKDGGRSFTQEMEHASDQISRRIVEELFLLHLMPLDRIWRESR